MYCTCVTTSAAYYILAFLFRSVTVCCLRRERYSRGLSRLPKRHITTVRCLKSCIQADTHSSPTTGCPSGVTPPTLLLESSPTISSHVSQVPCIYSCVLRIHPGHLNYIMKSRSILLLACSHSQTISTFSQ